MYREVETLNMLSLYTLGSPSKDFLGPFNRSWLRFVLEDWLTGTDETLSEFEFASESTNCRDSVYIF